MSLTITSPSFDKVYTMYAWRDNNIRLVLTQGEGLTASDGTVAHVKAPKFQLRDERGIIDLTSCDVTLALTRPDGSEDLLACSSASGEAAQGIISCPITASATAIAGQATGEIRVLSVDSSNPVGVIKFFGVHFQIHKGVSDEAAVQSIQYSALIDALRKVVNLQAGDIAVMDALTNGDLPNGTNPVASGNLKTYLQGKYTDFLRTKFLGFKYAHEAHSSSYDADTNPVDVYNDSEFEGVYIDDASELGTCYIIKNLNGARVGVLLCASVPTGTDYGRTQIALYYSGYFSYRYKHSNGGAWDEWTSIELQKNKDSYNSDDTTYFGITNDASKYPSSKSVYQFIQANAQTIADIFESIANSVLLGYDTLTIDKEFNIHKDVVETYLNNSDYSEDSEYTISALDDFDFGYETHGRPNKVTVTIPTGGVAIKYKDTVTGREWTEPTESTTYIQNLIPNRIYVYQILNANGGVLKTGTAKGSGKVRMINAGGDTYNIRDLGGWEADGGILKYGVVYRGSELNSGISITSAQQAFFRNALGVRDEIDLRSPAVGNTALGIGVDYFHTSIPYFSGEFSTSDYAKYASVMKRIAKDISENKPVYIHCQAGADRTAMICMFIEAVCGVSQNDIDRDYELTSFSKEPGTNNEWSNRILRKRNSTTSYHLKNIVSKINGMRGTTFNDKVVRFLLRTGVTIDELNTIRFGLIDGNPAKLSSPYSSMTVTNVLTNVSNSNTSSFVVEYQPYEAELKVNNMCKLTSVTITMGGDDANQYYSNGKISIPFVTGNIVIEALAAQNSIITESMIEDGAVTEDKLEDGAVTTDKIALGAIGTSELANGSVTADKMSFRAVKYVSDTEVDNCIDADTIYEVRTTDANSTTGRHTVICVPATYQRTQYLFAQEGGVQFRKALYNNGEWGSWSAWVSLTPKTVSFTVSSSGWNGLTYVMDSGMPSYANPNTKVDISMSDTVYNKLLEDGCTGLYVTTDTSGNTPTFTLHAGSNAPTSNITLQLTLQQIS